MDTKIMVDASVFIDYYRSRDKSDVLLRQLKRRYRELCVSSIAKFEVLCGTKDEDLAFWRKLFEQVDVFPFDDRVVPIARTIYRQLKKESRLLDLGDILIAATAIADDTPLATLNRKHFERIDGLRLVE